MILLVDLDDFGYNTDLIIHLTAYAILRESGKSQGSVNHNGLVRIVFAGPDDEYGL